MSSSSPVSFTCALPCAVCFSSQNSKVDIWSIGCIVIELATAKEPWAEKQFESSFAALYFIATKKNEYPYVPPTLSQAGHDFIRLCLTRDIDARPTAKELLGHRFVTEQFEGVEAAERRRAEGVKGPQSSVASTTSAMMAAAGASVDASIRETRSELLGTMAAAGRSESTAVGEYRPMASATVSAARMDLTAATGTGEDAQMSESSGDTSLFTVPMVGAAMTSPLP